MTLTVSINVNEPKSNFKSSNTGRNSSNIFGILHLFIMQLLFGSSKKTFTDYQSEDSAVFEEFVCICLWNPGIEKIK